MAESDFQKEVVKWLRRRGCYVLTITARPGIPDGCPDVIALMDGGGWIALECKKDAKSKFQPLQKPTIKKLNDMFYSKAIWPSNWKETQSEIINML